jgi:hypothetical protein
LKPFIAVEIILILVISLSSFNFSTTKEFSVEDGQPSTQNIGNTTRSLEVAPQGPSLLDNNSYTALPFLKFLNYYVNITNEPIRYLNCLEISHVSNQPETLIKTPCETLFIFIINNDNFTKNYNVPNSLSIQPFNYNNEWSYQLKLIPKLIADVDSKTKFYCGKIQGTVSFQTEIISCAKIGILIR